MRQALHPTTGAPASGIDTSRLLVSLRRRGAAVLARLHAQREAAATRAAVAELSEAQQADIGADGARDEPNRPIICVDGAVMRRLMAMR